MLLSTKRQIDFFTIIDKLTKVIHMLSTNARCQEANRVPMQIVDNLGTNWVQLMCNRKILSDSTDGLAMVAGHGIMNPSKAEMITSGAIVRVG